MDMHTERVGPPEPTSKGVSETCPACGRGALSSKSFPGRSRPFWVCSAGCSDAKIRAALDAGQTQTPAGPEGAEGSISEYLAEGERALASERAEHEPFMPDTARGGPGWPRPLGKDAYHGLTGDLARLIDPHTEADPAAIIFQFLALFGNVIGRSVFWTAEATRHALNLFVILIGATAGGRKGTSFDNVRTRFESVDEGWATSRIKSGLVSGEGIVYHVRDPAENPRRRGKGEIALADQGVADKRLMVYEPEFASVLRTSGRDGNTLSPVMRAAWDGGRLETLAKNSPTIATGAHISVIGHITKDEYTRYLDRTELLNGFGNRFLNVCVGRSKLLPFGGNMASVDFSQINAGLKAAVDFARKGHEMRRDSAADGLWGEEYERLTAGRPGLFGAATARGAAQTMRVSTLYASLDCSPTIGERHLRAGLECWRHSEESARFIFGDTLGDPVADEILQALRRNPAGMTRTQINHLFARHRTAEQIGRALDLLLGRRMAFQKNVSTAGRPAETWFSTAGGAK
jgi:hypothetical protein